MRKHRRLIALAPLLFTLACDKETTAPTDAAPAEPMPQPAPAEPTEEEKAEAAKKQQEEAIDAALADIEKHFQERAAQWNEEREVEAQKLATTKFKKTAKALDAILASKHRDAENASRDPFRHPKETLVFFGIKPTDTVVETGPGMGWYTEILAPLLAAQGELRVPTFSGDGPKDRFLVYARRIELMLALSKGIYGAVKPVIQTGLPAKLTFGEPGSADMVIATREMHNWYRSGNWDVWMAASAEVLKKGGILAVEQHRAAEGANPDESVKSGRLPEAWIIEKVESAGFELAGKSDINANAKDTRDFPVWNLPPAGAVEDEAEKKKYAEIGESDRMTLRFKKK